MARSGRFGRPVSAIVIDLDDFKRIDDTLGHEVGDRVLCEVAACLESGTREHDIVVRMDGDEFVVLLPDTAEADACALAVRVHQPLSKRRIKPRPHHTVATASSDRVADTSH